MSGLSGLSGMKRWCVNSAVFLLLLGCSFGFYARAQRAQRLAAAGQNATFSLETPLSANDAQKLCGRESGQTFAVWGELSGETVSDPDLGRQVRADVLVYFGVPELILPLSGAAVADGGCLLGERTAYALFGSTAVSGDTVLVGDEEYTVLAVTGDVQSGVVIGGDAGGGVLAAASFDRITFEGALKTEQEMFLQQWGLRGEALRFDCLLGYGWLAELVPGKWSDFLGWRENADRKRREFAHLGTVRKNFVERCCEEQCLLYRRNVCLGALFGTAAAGYGFFCASRLREKSDGGRFRAFLKSYVRPHKSI